MRLVAVATLVAAFATPAVLAPTPASADLMQTCAPEIQAVCSDVREGRGRITSCLAANSDKASAACVAEVDAQLNKGIVRNRVPRGNTPLQGTSAGATLTAACGPELASLCSGVTPEAEAMIACLYARSDRVSKTCEDTSNAVLKTLN